MSNTELRKRIQAAARTHMMSEGGGFTKKLTKAAKGTNKFLKDTGAVSTVAALTGNPTTAALTQVLGYGCDDDGYSVYGDDEGGIGFGGVKHKSARRKDLKSSGSELTTVKHSAKFLAQAYQKEHPNWIPPAKKSYKPNYYAQFVRDSYDSARDEIDRAYPNQTPGERNKLTMQEIGSMWRASTGLQQTTYARIKPVPVGEPYVRKTNNPPRAPKQPLIVLGNGGRPQVEVVSKPKVAVRARPVVSMARPKVQVRPTNRR